MSIKVAFQVYFVFDTEQTQNNHTKKTSILNSILSIRQLIRRQIRSERASNALGLTQFSVGKTERKEKPADKLIQRKCHRVKGVDRAQNGPKKRLFTSMR